MVTTNSSFSSFVSAFLIFHPVVLRNSFFSTTSCNNGSEEDSDLAHHGRTEPSGICEEWLMENRYFHHFNRISLHIPFPISFSLDFYSNWDLFHFLFPPFSFPFFFSLFSIISFYFISFFFYFNAILILFFYSNFEKRN